MFRKINLLKVQIKIKYFQKILKLINKKINLKILIVI